MINYDKLLPNKVKVGDIIDHDKDNRTVVTRISDTKKAFVIYFKTRRVYERHQNGEPKDVYDRTGSHRQAKYPVVNGLFEGQCLTATQAGPKYSIYNASQWTRGRGLTPKAILVVV